MGMKVPGIIKFAVFFAVLLLFSDLWLVKGADVTSNTIYVLKGHEVILPCKVPSAVDESVEWIRNGKKDELIYLVDTDFGRFENGDYKFLINKSTRYFNLSISNAQFSHSGIYRCLRNFKATSSSDYISDHLVVRLVVTSKPSPPKIVDELNGELQKAVGTDQKAQITCTSANGVPPPTFHWFRGNGVNITNSAIVAVKQRGDTTSSTITITSPDLDNTKFTCQISHPALKKSSPTLSTSVKFIKLVTPGKPILSDAPDLGSPDQRWASFRRSAKVGERLRVRCESTSGKPLPDLIWYRRPPNHDNYVAINSDHYSNGLSVINIFDWTITKRDNGASFRCSASNKAATVSTEFKLDVLYTPDTVEVKAVPSGPVEIGKKVKLKCLAKGGNPAPSLRWSDSMSLLAKDNKIYYKRDGSKKVIETWINRTIKVENTTNVSSLRYICISNTGHGVHDKRPATINLSIIRFDKPEISFQTKPFSTYTNTNGKVNVSIEEGKTYGFSCSVKSTTVSDSPKIYWYTQTEGSAEKAYIGRDNVLKAETFLESQIFIGQNFLKKAISGPASAIKQTYIFCKAKLPKKKTDQYTKTSDKFLLNILYAPVSVALSTPNDTTEAGTEMVINCTSGKSNPPAKIIWQIDGVKISPTIGSTFENRTGGGSTKSTLKIMVSAKDDGATLKCSANNERFPDRGAYSSTQLKISHKPEFIASDDFISKPYDENVEFKREFEFSANPPPKASISGPKKLKKKNKDSIAGVKIKNSKTVVVRIKKLKYMYNNGTYTITLKNDKGTAKLKFSIRVNYGPHLTPVKKSRVVVNPGDSVILNCTVEAVPPPQLSDFFWQRLSENFVIPVATVGVPHLTKVKLPMDASSLVKMPKSGNKYTLSTRVTNVTVADIATYDCVYKNNKKISASVKLGVRFKPKIITTPRNFMKVPRPRVAAWQSVESGRAGWSTGERKAASLLSPFESKAILTVPFTCTIEAAEWDNPTKGGQGLTVKWFKNDTKKELSKVSKKYNISNVSSRKMYDYLYEYTSMLFINHVDRSDVGGYNCRVWNEVGIDQRTFYVTEYSLPEPPFGLKIEERSDDSVIVSFRRNFDGGKNAKYFIRYQIKGADYVTQTSNFTAENSITKKDVVYFTPEAQQNDADRLRYRLKDLKPGSNYEARLYAVNMLGTSRSSEVLPFTTLHIIDPLTGNFGEMTPQEGATPLIVILSLVLAGFILLLLNFILIFYLVKRKNKKLQHPPDSTCGTESTTSEELSRSTTGGAGMGGPVADVEMTQLPPLYHPDYNVDSGQASLSSEEAGIGIGENVAFRTKTLRPGSQLAGSYIEGHENNIDAGSALFFDKLANYPTYATGGMYDVMNTSATGVSMGDESGTGAHQLPFDYFPTSVHHQLPPPPHLYDSAPGGRRQMSTPQPYPPTPHHQHQYLTQERQPKPDLISGGFNSYQPPPPPVGAPSRLIGRVPSIHRSDSLNCYPSPPHYLPHSVSANTNLNPDGRHYQSPNGGVPGALSPDASEIYIVGARNRGYTPPPRPPPLHSSSSAQDIAPHARSISLVQPPVAPLSSYAPTSRPPAPAATGVQATMRRPQPNVNGSLQGSTNVSSSSSTAAAPVVPGVTSPITVSAPIAPLSSSSSIRNSYTDASPNSMSSFLRNNSPGGSSSSSSTTVVRAMPARVVTDSQTNGTSQIKAHLV